MDDEATPEGGHSPLTGAMPPGRPTGRLADEVYDTLLGQLMSLRIEPGSRVTIDVLARHPLLRRDGPDRASSRNVKIVMELVERLLEFWVVAEARADFNELTARRLHPVTVRRNVGEVWISLAPRHERQNRGDAGDGAES